MTWSLMLAIGRSREFTMLMPVMGITHAGMRVLQRLMAMLMGMPERLIQGGARLLP